MYRTGPAIPNAGLAGLGLRLGVRHVFDGSSTEPRDPMLGSYLADMLSPYGLALRDDVDLRTAGHSYGEMAGSLIAELTRQGLSPMDLIIFAFAVPDITPGRPTSAHLAHICPGEPLAFAICDQGIAAPYTALRVLLAHGSSGSCDRALLLVAEQATAFSDPPAPVDLPTSNVAVGLLFDTDGPGNVGQSHISAIRQLSGVCEAAALDVLGAEVTDLAAGHADVTLITGPGLRPHAPLLDRVWDELVVAPPGQPCTGVWWELVGGLASWAVAGRRVLLADYEPVLEYLCVAAIDVAASPGTLPSASAGPATERYVRTA